MSDTNLYLYPTWKTADAAKWKKALSSLVTREVIGRTGEGEEEGEIWFVAGKRSAGAIRGASEPAFEDCRIHMGDTYFIPDGDTRDLGASCPSCSASVEDAIAVEAIVDFNENDDQDDRTRCPKCNKRLDVPAMKFKVKTAMVPAFVCFVGVKGEAPTPELMKSLEEATGCAWDSMTAKVEL